ncbi:MAG: UDP-3-O-(3-hydroxymyristoyl)glucosamine N-acyltransferase [Desulfobacteraceae bacterium]|uniref:UDP-3-O-acylglucosamine N-acyltransferase n=1 Tax=Candidatus Desulfacyla euxinica TaxID=2841693 RepID=A0A8J6N152_9DELT|nr:UDP-3-O-(3-hydroxymyristoyl)glucosamine N-acyltransferase [Candidatus Desulfacyla euxinica]MBL6978615.1 UDP-3-O-(3-hydroxymyristoyl)glucosamine N-acyltransferase [Desulfobacteraceae bacterium]
MEITLEKIAEIVGGEVLGDKSFVITGINSLDDAEPSEISFLANRRYAAAIKKTRAGAILISRDDPSFKGVKVLVSSPELSYAKVAAIFAPPLSRHPRVSREAVIHENSLIGKDVSIYPLVYVGEGAEIGDETTIFPGVFIGERVKIGKRSLIYPNVTILRDCLIGNEVIIHSGTVIGDDGFGFVRDGTSSIKIPQTGIVQIDDNVEIGVNNCVDRAALGKTWIKRGVKTDNLVQIAHNVVIGEDSVIVAQAGISGSCHIGREVIIGGQVGIIDHIEIGDRAMIAAQSGIVKSIPPGEVVSGSPAISHRLHLKTSSLTKRLPEFNQRLRDLEKKIEELEKQSEKDEV